MIESPFFIFIIEIICIHTGYSDIVYRRSYNAYVFINVIFKNPLLIYISIQQDEKARTENKKKPVRSIRQTGGKTTTEINIYSFKHNNNSQAIPKILNRG